MLMMLLFPFGDDVARGWLGGRGGRRIAHVIIVAMTTVMIVRGYGSEVMVVVMATVWWWRLRWPWSLAAAA